MNREQLTVIRGLVGDAIAQQDLPALEKAYRDFRAGMDSLKADFEQQLRVDEQKTPAGQEVPQ
ncbi:hypothetical protein [Paenarthrobacter sp. YIM B13468]|uniref:hypothetical protein n=1 Tax=Paenarthrobacter sp. YIM B13468 TaxID=3366295 RepID=UPI00366D381F